MLHLVVIVTIGRSPLVLVKFLVVIILDVAGSGLHIAHLFATVVLAATGGTVAMGRLDGIVAALGEFGDEGGDEGQEGQRSEGDE